MPDHIIATLKELIEPLKAAFQLKEFSDLVDTTFNYIEKVNFSKKLLIQPFSDNSMGFFLCRKCKINKSTILTS